MQIMKQSEAACFVKEPNTIFLLICSYILLSSTYIKISVIRSLVGKGNFIYLEIMGTTRDVTGRVSAYCEEQVMLLTSKTE